jgi:hypothetical protein
MLKVISLQTSKMKEVELIDLSRNLMLNSIVSSADGALGLITHQDLVFFAHTWATWALEASKAKPPEAVEALRLVGLWLEDPESVSNEELKAAAEASWAATRAAAWSAGVAARAAGAAAEAAEAATWATGAAARAAAEAAEAAGAARSDTYQKQGEFILEHLQKTSQTSFPFRRA